MLSLFELPFLSLAHRGFVPSHPTTLPILPATLSAGPAAHSAFHRAQRSNFVDRRSSYFVARVTFAAVDFWSRHVDDLQIRFCGVVIRRVDAHEIHWDVEQLTSFDGDFANYHDVVSANRHVAYFVSVLVADFEALDAAVLEIGRVADCLTGRDADSAIGHDHGNPYCFLVAASGPTGPPLSIWSSS